MTMTDNQLLLMIALVALGTLATRALPFLLFPEGKAVPPVMLYLGRVLPYAVSGMLVVYCLKDVSPLTAPHGLPEGIGIAVVAILYLWRRSSLLAIAGGTLCYMLLLQFVF